MGRRSRPSHRVPPRNKSTPSRVHVTNLKGGAPRTARTGKSRGQTASEPHDGWHSEDDGSGEDLGLESSEDGEADDFSDAEDVDAPRVSQWVDDDFEALSEQESLSEDEEPDAGPSQLKKLQSNLSQMPFGTLRKAQYALNDVEAASDSEDGDSDDSDNISTSSRGDSVPVAQSSKVISPEWSTKPRSDIAKRPNKHAPMEVTSKRPITRFRQVVEVKKTESRDPRFLPLAGEFKADKFHQSYGFLSEARGKELSTLRESLKRARKMMNNAPRHLRNDYGAEVERLELAVKKAESVVNRDRMDRIQREALQKVSKEEKEKRELGKGQWFLKKSEKRELVTRARYEALAAEGGKRAVKKAIEKKQKKISQREKKSRPFPKGGPPSESRKRPVSDNDDPRKRRRVG